MNEYISKAMELAIAWSVPLSILACALAAGWFFHGVVIKRLVRALPPSGWEPAKVIRAALRRMVIFWFLLAGAYIAALSISPEEAALSTVRKWVTVLAIFTVTIVVSRAIVGIIGVYAKKTEAVLPSASIFSNIARAVVFIVGILVILQFLGISIAPILTALGVGGLAVALALQDTLSNLFAGLQIIVSRQIRKGDYVEIDAGQSGYVMDISWRNTIIRGSGNNHIIIPNSRLANSVVVNYHLVEKDISVVVPVGVAYDSDLDLVERVSFEVAMEVQGGLPEAAEGFRPTVGFSGFKDSEIALNIVMRAREYAGQYAIRHELVKRLHRRYAEEGIEIPFPVRTVQMKESLKKSR